MIVIVIVGIIEIEMAGMKEEEIMVAVIMIGVCVIVSFFYVICTAD